MTVQDILQKQRSFFATGATLPVKFRIAMLKKLYAAVCKFENAIASASSQAAAV